MNKFFFYPFPPASPRLCCSGSRLSWVLQTSFFSASLSGSSWGCQPVSRPHGICDLMMWPRVLGLPKRNLIAGSCTHNLVLLLKLGLSIFLLLRQTTKWRALPWGSVTSSPQQSGTIATIEYMLHKTDHQSPAPSSHHPWTKPDILELWDLDHPEWTTHRCSVENHNLRFWGADLLPSRFTLSSKPPQCVLKVIDHTHQQNHIICKKKVETPS